MTQLISINTSVVGSEEQQTVNARELHSFLEVGRDFATWIKQRIEKYDFEENQDFILVHQNGGIKEGVGRGGDRRSIEYHLSLDIDTDLI